MSLTVTVGLRVNPVSANCWAMCAIAPPVGAKVSIDHEKDAAEDALPSESAAVTLNV